MKKVIIPRGLPGSGKTTWVKNELLKHEAGTAVRISNDDLSFMLYGRPWGTFFFSDITKKTLHKLRLSMLKTFLSQEGIEYVYIDNTNLAIQTVNSLYDLAVRMGAEVIVEDMFLSVSIDECISRDSKREAPVGADIIRNMAKQSSRIKPWKSYDVPVVLPYTGQDLEMSAVIVDIDGTLAHMQGRDVYDDSLVHTDLVDDNVRYIVNHMFRWSSRVIVMSGRSESCRGVTEQWLKDRGVQYDALYMRAAGDYRPDWIVKYELFQAHVAGKYSVRLVLDDRDQVVDLWRNKLGLPTWQVAEGDF